MKERQEQSSGLTPQEYKQMQEKFVEALDEMHKDPKILEQAEEFRKKAASIPLEEWLRPFDI